MAPSRPPPHIGVPPPVGPGARPLGPVGGDAGLERLRDLVMHAPAMVWFLRGPAHVVELANEPARQAARSGGEVIGCPAGEALPDLARQGVLALLDRVRATGEPPVAEEVRLLGD